MKITKTKEVVTEELEVQPGEYYFEIELRSYKMIVGETDEWNYTKYKMETLNNFSNFYSIVIHDDELTYSDVPYAFKQFILGEAGRKITKEEYEKEREETLKRIIEDDKVTFAQ